MLDHLLEPEPELHIQPLDVKNASYEPLAGASPGQVMKAKMGAAQELAPLSPPQDPALSATLARAAVAPMLVGADQAAMAGQLALLQDEGAIGHVRALLTAFDYDFLQHAGQIRNLLVAKLIEDTENPKPQARLKAIELLGKVTEVGLFTENIKHSTDSMSEIELEKRLTEKIARFTGTSTVKPHAEDVEEVVKEVFEAVNVRKTRKKDPQEG
jgi:hypothetical protein